MILHGDCLEVLEDLPAAQYDSLITDPPAGIAFMGKDWDKDKGGRDEWIEWMTQVMRECLRVLKPGAHGFVWALPRTSHWTATALENAGFEVRDIVMHVFGSGFPKSHDVSKALDKMAGVEREVTGPYQDPDGSKRVIKDRGNKTVISKLSSHIRRPDRTAPSTDAAKQWDGWGTALKPAAEHWILVRVPLEEKTVAKNVLKHGTGGINIDGCRVETGENLGRALSAKSKTSPIAFQTSPKGAGSVNDNWKKGRFPSNFICSTPELLDEQSGERGLSKKGSRTRNKNFEGWGHTGSSDVMGYEDRGGASRFFYCAKASKSERNAGCEINRHPTVKSQKLMRYLCRMVTPHGGTVLDPFTGSGSTGVAALSEGFDFLGIEAEKEYVEIANARLEYARTEAEGQIPLGV